MRTLQILIVFFSLIVVSCNDNLKQPVSNQETAKFILDSSELSLISDSLCDFQISFDSLNSISQYDSIRRRFFSVETNIGKKVCMDFTYQGDINAKSKKVFIQSIPTSYGLVATTIPAHSILHITAFETTLISDIAGNEFHNGQTSSDSLHNYIRRLFLNPPDSSRYGEKRVTFHFPNDSIHLANKYLTELVIGYIAAQRQICKSRFHKDLKVASTDEVKELKRSMPLRFKIISVKTTANIGIANSGAGH